MNIFKKAFAFLAASVMAFSAFTVTVFAENSDKVVDDADILSDTEELALETKINEIIEKYDYSYDIVIHTTNSTGGKHIEAYADDYYDYNDYGYDSQSSGIIFVVDMGERYWHMGTTGKGIIVFTDYGLEKIDDKVIGYLSDGDYYRCFYKFAELADDYINQYESTGEAYDVRRSSGSPGSSGLSRAEREGTIEVLFTSCVIGLIAALIVCLSLKSQLKSAKMQTNARDYIRAGSFRVTNSREYFLYRNVTRTKIDRDSGGGGSHHGGSSTHRSSSGRSHGGRSGRF